MSLQPYLHLNYFHLTAMSHKNYMDSRNCCLELKSKRRRKKHCIALLHYPKKYELKKWNNNIFAAFAPSTGLHYTASQAGGSNMISQLALTQCGWRENAALTSKNTFNTIK